MRSEMSLPKMHCALLCGGSGGGGGGGRGSSGGSDATSCQQLCQLFQCTGQEVKLFQSPLKGCFQSIHIGSVGKDKREVPRRLCGVIVHTEQAGSSAKSIGNVRAPQCQRSKC